MELPKAIEVVVKLEAAISRYEAGVWNPPLLDEIDKYMKDLRSLLASAKWAQSMLRLIQGRIDQLKVPAVTKLSRELAGHDKRMALKSCEALKALLQLESK